MSNKAIDFDGFSDDEYADSDDNSPSASSAMFKGNAQDNVTVQVGYEDVGDGFELDTEEQARLDLEHEQIYSSQSAFREVVESDEVAEEDATIEALESVLKRSQAHDTFEIAQAALQTVDMEVIERQQQIETKLRQSVRKQSKFGTLRRKPKMETPLVPEHTVKKREIDALLYEKQSENKKKKEEARLRLRAEIQATQQATSSPVRQTIHIPTNRAQVADWELEDVQGWLSSVVPHKNFKMWCSIAEDRQWCGSKLLALNYETLDTCSQDYYTIAADIPVVHAGLKQLKRDGAKQGKRTLRKMFSDATKLRSKKH